MTSQLTIIKYFTQEMSKYIVLNSEWTSILDMDYMAIYSSYIIYTNLVHTYMEYGLVCIHSTVD